jgi:hypothetical protein
MKLSTTVPLTGKVLKPTLLGIEHCSTYHGRRKFIETMGGESVYRLGTGLWPILLDIGVLRYRLTPGLYLIPEAQCHADLRLSF